MSRPSTWRLRSRRLVRECDLPRAGSRCPPVGPGWQETRPGASPKDGGVGREGEQLRLRSLGLCVQRGASAGWALRAGRALERKAKPLPSGHSPGAGQSGTTSKNCEARQHPGRREKASQAAAALCTPHPENKHTLAACRKRGWGATLPPLLIRLPCVPSAFLQRPFTLRAR